MTPQALVDDMGVDNVAFLLESLGADASELQYLRELVQNAFESIQRAGRGFDGRVEIDFKEVEGVRKLRITDNGAGMTPEEVKENINRLSASGGIQSFEKNFGIGAKITAGTRNPHGVVYESWKDGKGSSTILGRVAGRYGRIGFSVGDDSVEYSLPLGNEDKHEIITDSGVSVVLLGESAQDDTTQAPPGAYVSHNWIAAYLERRYFMLPSGITLRVRRPGYVQDAERGQRPVHNTVRGQRHYLDLYSDAKGRLNIAEANARVWWWLLTEDTTKGGARWNNGGHVAALYQDELYEVRSGSSRTSALKDFGIYAGYGRVVIYVEPTDVLKANTPRTALILRGSHRIDYASIGAFFADQMPDELAAYMAGQVTSGRGDHRKAIRKNLKEVEDAFAQARYRRSEQGKPDHFEPEGGVERGTSPNPPSPPGPPHPRPEDATSRVGSEYLRKAREEQEERLKAKKSTEDQMPRIVWDTKGSTVPAGRAATYVPANHTVTASTSFGFYRDMLEWALGEAQARVAGEGDEETLRSICEDEIQRWFEYALTDAVVVLRPLSHSAQWGPMVYETALSDEGLTAAVVSHRWHMMTAVKRGLAGQLGSAKKAA